ncbi:MAG TPA: hypothetical protein VF151_00730 [Gemmatimonadales bacterium]
MPQPYPGQQWKHGWIPLTAAAVRQKNHGRTPGPTSKLGRRLQSISRGGGTSGGRSSGTGARTGTSASPSALMDAAIRARASRLPSRTGGTRRETQPSATQPQQQRPRNVVRVFRSPEGNIQYITSPNAERITRSASAQRMTPVPGSGNHTAALARAPRQLRQVWDVAERNGWTAVYSPYERGPGDILHQLSLQGPNGERYQMTWSGNRRGTNELPARTIINAIENPESEANRQAREQARAEREFQLARLQREEEIRRSAGMTPQQQLAEQERRRREEIAASERERLEAARREQAEREARARAELARIEAAERRQEEANRRIEEEQRRRREQEEADRRRREQEKQQKQQRVDELETQAARAYREGDFQQALSLINEAIIEAPDPITRARLEQRKQFVMNAMITGRK